MSADEVDTDEDTSAAGTAAADRGRSESGAGWLRRAGAGLLGGSLLVYGLKRRSLGGAAVALVGGALSARAVWTLVRPDRKPGMSVDPDKTGSAGSPTMERSVTIDRSPDELSELLRDPDTLERITGPFAEIESEGEDRHRWSVETPVGRSVSWETEVEAEDPDEQLRWEPVEGSALFDEWAVEFEPAPGDRGTQTALRLRVDPPGGSIGRKAVERLDVVPETLAGTVLDRLKSLAETGEVPTTERNPSARGRGDLV